jgi:hypothetical protein
MTLAKIGGLYIAYFKTPPRPNRYESGPVRHRDNAQSAQED